MEYLEDYLKVVSDKNPAIARSIKKTVNDVVPKWIDNFTWKDNDVYLLVGDVQSGKTGQVFGIISAAADEGFPIFILLTTDNVLLQQQTFNRASKVLNQFCVCDENDFIKFKDNNLRKPSLIVLKKNAHVLKRWRDNFTTISSCVGNPLFLIDDEADAASLNTLVNKNEQSSINRLLESLKETASCSIYLEVTGTPQSLLLQSDKSDWKPRLAYYFRPGDEYIGGNNLFLENPPKQIVYTDDQESKDIIDDDEFPENGLKQALVTHLISSAELLLSDDEVSNFLVHPSMKTDQHQKFAEKIGNYLNEIVNSYDDSETKQTFLNSYAALKETKNDLSPFKQLYSYVIDQIKQDKIGLYVLNSKERFVAKDEFQTGINIIVGGNSLGRGVTFPKLQTIYYCRLSTNPQADTMWQHARMFGYDRNFKLMRIYMPPKLYKLFSDINKTNNSIIKQIESTSECSDIKIVYPPTLHPSRKNVLDEKQVTVYAGGVNYFPFYPVNKGIDEIDEFLEKFPDGNYQVNLKIISKLLELVDGSFKDDWDSKAFRGFVQSIRATNSLEQGILICRRNRDIGKSTGTLLSPNDRTLGDKYPNSVVLTMYKVTGSKGWNGEKLWIPNIKLPNGQIYFTAE